MQHAHKGRTEYVSDYFPTTQKSNRNVSAESLTPITTRNTNEYVIIDF